MIHNFASKRDVFKKALFCRVSLGYKAVVVINIDCSMMFCFYFYLSNPKENCNREKNSSIFQVPHVLCYGVTLTGSSTMTKKISSGLKMLVIGWFPIVLLHLQVSQTTNSVNFQEQIVSRRERKIFLQRKYERRRKLLILNFDKVCNN